MLYLPYVGMPNILAGERLVPELLQDQATPANLAGALLTLLRDLSARIKPLARKANPFRGVPAAIARTARWVEPKLVAEIAYTEFTDDNILRHPSFIALREDRDPRSVVLEKPKEAP